MNELIDQLEMTFWSLKSYLFNQYVATNQWCNHDFIFTQKCCNPVSQKGEIFLCHRLFCGLLNWVKIDGWKMSPSNSKYSWNGLLCTCELKYQICKKIFIKWNEIDLSSFHLEVMHSCIFRLYLCILKHYKCYWFVKLFVSMDTISPPLFRAAVFQYQSHHIQTSGWCCLRLTCFDQHRQTDLQTWEK